MSQGNGTAAIFEGDERVTTFDMHGVSASLTLGNSMNTVIDVQPANHVETP